MKKYLIFNLVFTLASICFAQKDVTKFLGIPVDGTKTAMIQKLKAKGFSYNAKTDCLKGEFNGQDVEVHVVTNNNKVYRIFVVDAIGVDESEIKVRFNNLCKQFEKNEKYVPADLEGRYELDEKEDISYEMIVNKKRYQASYSQLTPSDIDTTDLQKYALSQLSIDDVEKMSDKEKMEVMIKLSTEYMVNIMSNKSVWFMIDEKYGMYYILMYYDNGYNKADGEDL